MNICLNPCLTRPRASSARHLRKKPLPKPAASVKSDSFEGGGLAGADLLTILQAGDERADVQTVYRNGPARGGARFDARAGVIRNTVGGGHPKTVKNFI